MWAVGCVFAEMLRRMPLFNVIKINFNPNRIEKKIFRLCVFFLNKIFMVTNKQLQGTTDIEQLALVIKILGNPNAEDWPEMDSLPDYKKIQYVFL